MLGLAIFQEGAILLGQSSSTLLSPSQDQHIETSCGLSGMDKILKN